MRPPPNLEGGPNAGIRANPLLERGITILTPLHCMGFARIPAFSPPSKFGGGRIYIVFTKKSPKILPPVCLRREIQISPENPRKFFIVYAWSGIFEIHQKIPKISSSCVTKAWNSNFPPSAISPENPQNFLLQHTFSRHSVKIQISRHFARKSPKLFAPAWHTFSRYSVTIGTNSGI